MTIVQKTNVKSPVRQLLRQLAPVSGIPANRGYRTVEEVGSELSSLLLQGYHIVNTHYFGKQIDNETGVEYFGVFYVLQLSQSEIDLMRNAEVSAVEKRMEGDEG